jgi:predicted nucleic acid-binding protein
MIARPRLPLRQNAIDVTYLRDPNAISDLMRAAPRIEGWMAGLGQGDRVVTCMIVRGEILFGIARVPAGRRRTELEEAGRRFLDVLPCEPIPALAGDFYATIKLARQKHGLTPDENDLWVGATALALGATLVSRDGDFRGIVGGCWGTVSRW